MTQPEHIPGAVRPPSDFKSGEAKEIWRLFAYVLIAGFIGGAAGALFGAFVAMISPFFVGSLVSKVIILDGSMAVQFANTPTGAALGAICGLFIAVGVMIIIVAVVSFSRALSKGQEAK